MPQSPSLPGTTDRRLAALLTLLAENATIVISGARIARGDRRMSRSTVWRWVEELRKLGVQVKGSAARIFSGESAGYPDAGPAAQAAEGQFVRQARVIIFSRRTRRIVWRWNWDTRANRKARW